MFYTMLLNRKVKQIQIINIFYGCTNRDKVVKFETVHTKQKRKKDFKMNIKTKGAVYQLVETPSATPEISVDIATVYSALALYPDGDFFKTCFVYDISRTKETARDIVEQLCEMKPKEEDLIDMISELI